MWHTYEQKGRLHRALSSSFSYLMTTTPHLIYVATLPCNLSLIACFLTLQFHKVVWQHKQGVVRSLITVLLQIYQGIRQ